MPRKKRQPIIKEGNPIEEYTQDCIQLESTALNVSKAKATLRYHLNLQEGHKDFNHYTNDMRTLFEWLYNDCREFVIAYESNIDKRKPVARQKDMPVWEWEA